MLNLIQIPYWWHATIFEVLWLVSGVAGVAITTINVADSQADRPVLDRIRKDTTVHESHYQMIELAVRGRLESQWIRLLICTLITASGVFGVMQPNPLRGGTTWTGFVVTLTLIGIAALTAAKSWLDYRQRDKMFELAMGRSAVQAARLLAEESRKKNLKG
jgi:hypothetical protein